MHVSPAHPYAQNGHLASPQDNSDESEESGRTTSLAIGEDVDIEDENGVVPALANLSLATSQQVRGCYWVVWSEMGTAPV